MKIGNIREMSDKELYTFINNISNNNGRICCKCGSIVYKDNRITLSRNIDVANKKMWIKWADSLGQSNTETYKFEPLEEQKQALEEKPAFDTSLFAQKDDLKNMATRQDLDALKQTIEKLEKQVKINQILAEKPAQPKAE